MIPRHIRANVVGIREELRRRLVVLWKVDFVLFLAGTAWLALLELKFAPRAVGGMYFQVWSSEDLQQTLPIAMLRDFPLRSLFYLHIQPPLLDTLRAVIAKLVRPDPGASLVMAVDRWLYVGQAVLFGFTSRQLYLWARQVTDKWFALALWVGWVLHPAPLFYASFLDSTFIGSCFIFLFAYELWRLSHPNGSIYRLAIFGLCVFFARTVFQWYYVPVTVVALVLSRATWRQVGVFVAVSALGVAPWLLKQKLLFGTLSTTSFSGYHQAGIIWYQPTNDEIEATKRQVDSHYPQAAKLYEGGKTFNTEAVAVDNLVYSTLSGRQWATQRRRCLEGIWKSIRQNSHTFWWPSSRYQSHVIVDNLPWRGVYDRVFCGWSYRLVLLLGGLAWLWRWHRQWRRRFDEDTSAARQQLGRAAGLLLVTSFVFATCLLANRYEWVESNRLKYLIEPLFFLFITTSLYTLVKKECFPFIRR